MSDTLTPGTPPANPPKQPPGTTQVRIRDRAREAPWGSGPLDPVIMTVTIADTCPKCGGPRGEPRNLNSHDDGVWYSVDVWTNPCGHTDYYVAVAQEAERLGYPTTREFTSS